jgi:anti-sigma B factor antagonist
MKMTTATRQVDGLTIVDISGQIVFGEESAALRVLVCDLLGEGHRKILLNLADVNYIDSTGLGSLVSAVASVRKVKGDLKLLKLTDKVHGTLQITKLHTVIDIMDDEAAAIESFSRAITATA